MEMVVLIAFILTQEEGNSVALVRCLFEGMNE
jgi:hypothetical protein